MAGEDGEDKGRLLDRARTVLAIDASPTAQAILEKHLGLLASELLLEWLVGDKRFESQSQQTEYWLARFYEEIFVDEQPDATRIYERFGVNLPRASYLARLLRARRAALWRQSAQVELKTQLERHKARADEAKKEGQAHVTEFDISLSPGSADELRVIYDRIATFVAERERPKPPKAKPSFGNSRWLAVPAETLLLVLETLRPADAAT